MKNGKASGWEDQRRRHHHWQVIVSYGDKEKFARVYNDRNKAEKFAERQKKSPIVKGVRVIDLS